MKEENTVTKILDDEIQFDGKIIKKICFDLEHINRGWDKCKNDYHTTRRSNYSEENVIELFEQFGFYTIQWDEGPGGNKFQEMVRGTIHFRYVASVFDHVNKARKKIVIDIPEKFENIGVIVTIY